MSGREAGAELARASEVPIGHHVETLALRRGREGRRGALNTLRVAVLIASTITMGLTAGAFALYAHTIMPGLGETDDRTFVGAFQALARAITNPWFLGGRFFGALVFNIIAVIVHIGRSGLPWIGGALALYAI